MAAEDPVSKAIPGYPPGVQAIPGAPFFFLSGAVPTYQGREEGAAITFGSTPVVSVRGGEEEDLVERRRREEAEYAWAAEDTEERRREEEEGALAAEVAEEHRRRGEEGAWAAEDLEVSGDWGGDWELEEVRRFEEVRWLEEARRLEEVRSLEGVATAGLHPTLLQNMECFHQLSEYHRDIVPAVLTGRDLIVVDREGVEVALLLPILHRMLAEEAPTRCLVVTHTEEEVERFSEAAEKLVEDTDINCVTIDWILNTKYLSSVSEVSEAIYGFLSPGGLGSSYLDVSAREVMVVTMKHFGDIYKAVGGRLLRGSKYFVMTEADAILAKGRESGFPEELELEMCAREATAGHQAIVVAGALPGGAQEALGRLLHQTYQSICPGRPADSGLETDIANIKLAIEEDEIDMGEICKKMEDIKMMKEDVKTMQRKLQLKQKVLQEKEVGVKRDFARLKTKRVDGSHIEFLLAAITGKEEGLECPVCLTEASLPIYCCSQFHLVCSTCRADRRLAACPTCREQFVEGESRRSRFAEREAEELARLRAELTRLTS